MNPRLGSQSENEFWDSDLSGTAVGVLEGAMTATKSGTEEVEDLQFKKSE